MLSFWFTVCWLHHWTQSWLIFFLQVFPLLLRYENFYYKNKLGGWLGSDVISGVSRFQFQTPAKNWDRLLKKRFLFQIEVRRGWPWKSKRGFSKFWCHPNSRFIFHRIKTCQLTNASNLVTFALKEFQF